MVTSFVDALVKLKVNLAWLSLAVAFVVFVSLSQTRLVSDAGAWNGIAGMETGWGIDEMPSANNLTPTKMALTIPQRISILIITG